MGMGMGIILLKEMKVDERHFQVDVLKLLEFLPCYKCTKVSIGQSNAEKNHADHDLHAIP